MNEILAKLKEGNEFFIHEKSVSDISRETRRKTAEEGQHPFAVVLTCADSRLLPNQTFSAGIGDLFVVRTAGNVVGPTTLWSIEYGLKLGAQLVLVMGHTKCGAINAVLGGEHDGHISDIIKEIAPALGDEREPLKCTELNVNNSIRKIKETIETGDVPVIGAIYNMESGKVDFLD